MRLSCAKLSAEAGNHAKSAAFYNDVCDTYLEAGRLDHAIKMKMKSSHALGKSGDEKGAFERMLEACKLVEEGDAKGTNVGEIYEVAMRACIEAQRFKEALEMIRKLQKNSETRGYKVARWKYFLCESVVLCKIDPDGIAASNALEGHEKVGDYLMSKEYVAERELVGAFVEDDRDRLSKIIQARGGALSYIDNHVARIAMRLELKGAEGTLGGGGDGSDATIEIPSNASASTDVETIATKTEGATITEKPTGTTPPSADTDKAVDVAPPDVPSSSTDAVEAPYMSDSDEDDY